MYGTVNATTAGTIEVATAFDPRVYVAHGRDRMAELVAAEAKRATLAWWDDTGPRKGESADDFERRYARSCGVAVVTGIRAFVSVEESHA